MRLSKLVLLVSVLVASNCLRLSFDAPERYSLTEPNFDT